MRCRPPHRPPHRPVVPDLGGKHAVILHRPNPAVDALARQLDKIGLSMAGYRPDLLAEATVADYVFFDADMDQDAQLPWAPGAAPMPLIALIGSEAPGRVARAMALGASGQILKPLGDGGVFSALLIARQGFDQRAALHGRIVAHGRAPAENPAPPNAAPPRRYRR